MSQISSRGTSACNTQNWAAGLLATLWSSPAAPVSNDLKITDALERDIERRLLDGLDQKFR